MKIHSKRIEHAGELTVAQLWKAKKAQEKLVRSETKIQNVTRKEAA